MKPSIAEIKRIEATQALQKDVAALHEKVDALITMLEQKGIVPAAPKTRGRVKKEPAQEPTEEIKDEPTQENVTPEG